MRRPAVAACALALLTAGCSSGDGGSIAGAGRPEAARAVFLGDSYTAASDDGGGYVPVTAEGMGWTAVLEAVGGTGYVATSPGGGPYVTRLPAVMADDPDVVLVQGSTNDVGRPADDVRAAARDLYSALQDALPDAEVVVVGPLSPPGVDPAGVDVIRDVLAQEADAAGLPFVDPAAAGWLVPSTGLFADPIHPNETGYREMADELVEALRAADL